MLSVCALPPFHHGSTASSRRSLRRVNDFRACGIFLPWAQIGAGDPAVGRPGQPGPAQRPRHGERCRPQRLYHEAHIFKAACNSQDPLSRRETPQSTEKQLLTNHSAGWGQAIPGQEYPPCPLEHRGTWGEAKNARRHIRRSLASFRCKKKKK
jgi:hypothetical protein